jgi:hypothetical protein
MFLRMRLIGGHMRVQSVESFLARADQSDLAGGPLRIAEQYRRTPKNPRDGFGSSPFAQSSDRQRLAARQSGQIAIALFR